MTRVILGCKCPVCGGIETTEQKEVSEDELDVLLLTYIYCDEYYFDSVRLVQQADVMCEGCVKAGEEYDEPVIWDSFNKPYVQLVQVVVLTIG